MCGELGQVWGDHLLTHLQGVSPSRPWGFEFMFEDQTSILVLVACSDVKTLLLQGLNFGKLIKMCLLWVGS